MSFNNLKTIKLDLLRKSFMLVLMLMLSTLTFAQENTLALCNDGIDNDSDGLVDCDDPQCFFRVGNTPCACPSSNILWFVENDSLYWINLTSGTERLVGRQHQYDIVNGIGTEQLADVAFTPDGKLWGINYDSIFTLNANPGNSSAVFSSSFGSNIRFANSLAGLSNNTLLIGGLHPTANDSTVVVNYNPVTSTYTRLYTLGRTIFGTPAGDFAVVGSFIYLTTNNGIVKINTTVSGGAPTLIAGNTLCGYSSNGSSFGLTADRNGNLYIMNGNQVYRFNPTTNVCTSVRSVTGNFGIQPTGLTMYGDWGITCSEICNDGIDNDLDGLTDCADADCAVTASASTTGGGPSYCIGSTISLLATGGTNYSWSGPNGFTSLVASPSITSAATTNTGTYRVTVTSASGCTGTASTAVTVNVAPVISVTPNGPTTFCNGGNVILTASGATSYRWSTTAITNSITVTTAGNYSVTGTDANGCTGTPASSTPVVLNATPAISSSSSQAATACNLSDGSVTLSGLTASTAYTVTYNEPNGTLATRAITSNASGQVVATGLGSGTYTNFAVSSNGCKSNSISSVTVGGPARPTVSITPNNNNGTVCNAVSGVTLTASGGTSFSWSNGTNAAQTTIASSLSNQVYTVTVTQAGCSSSANITVLGLGVAPCNGFPLALPDNNSTRVNVSVTGNVLTNDRDSNTPTSATNPTVITNPRGSVVLNPTTGNYTYTPPLDFSGVDSFRYRICDAQGLCSDAWTYINVVQPTVTNQGPVASSDYNQTTPGTTVSGNLAANDYDLEGGALTYNPTAVNGPSRGSVSINSNGTYNYTPTPGFTGIDRFTYRVCDPQNVCTNAVVTINVTPNQTANGRPIANDDVNRTVVNTLVNGNVSINDRDPENGTLTYSTIIPPNKGSVVLNSNGTYSYSPNTGISGPDRFVYRVCDNGTPQQCDTATVYLVIDPLAPVTTPDVNTTLPSTPVIGSVLTNDYDVQNSPLTVNTVVTGPSAGATVVMSPNGTYSYTPAPNCITCRDSFQYTVCNALGNCTREWVYINVAPNTSIDNSPVLTTDYAEGTAGNSISGNLSSNDFDPEGGPLTVNTTPACNPAHGTVAISANGQYVYKPSGTYVGPDVFCYRACDAQGNCATQRVYVNVRPATTGNQRPYASDDVYNIPTGNSTTGNVSDNDRDPDGDPLTYNVVNNTACGTVIMQANGQFAYSSGTAICVGTNRFIYRVCDNQGKCDTATAYITVQPALPRAQPDFNATFINTNVSGSVATNDLDPNSSTGVLTFSNRAGNTTTARGGSVTVNSNGTYNYIPPTNFVGRDSFRYTVCNAYGLCQDVWTYVAVIEASTQNDKPVALPDFEFIRPGATFTSTAANNDLDSETGRPTSYSIVSNPKCGAVTMTATGTYTYVSTPSSTCTRDSFSYRACDNASPAQCSEAYVYINITPDPTPGVNDGPWLNDDNSFTEFNKPVNGTVSVNDRDPNNDQLTFSVPSSTTAQGGTVTMNPGGTYSYTPRSGYSGPDRFVYNACDNGTPQICLPATVYINVLPSAPKAEADINFTSGLPVSGSVVTNDRINAPALTSVKLTQTTAAKPRNGSVTIDQTTGTYVYTPSNTTNPQRDSFRYVICNSVGCDSAWVYINTPLDTKPANNAPVANIDIVETAVGVRVTFSTASNDFDPEGGALTNPTILSNPKNGAVIVNADGTIRYTPNPNFSGRDSFYYNVCDNATPPSCTNSTVYITIYPNNNGPFAQDDATQTTQGISVTRTVVGNDTDPTGATLTYGIQTPMPASQGTVVLEPNGTYIYTPAAGFSGVASFTYSACNASNTCDLATVYIYVQPGVQPIANADYVHANPSGAVTIYPLVNDTYAKPLGSVTVTKQPANGSVVWNPVDNTFAYTSTNGQCTPDNFIYQITDATGLSDTALVDISCSSLIVYQGLSPNADGKNDTWTILNIEAYPNNRVRLYNRWGNLIFDMKGYTNGIPAKSFKGDWEGVSLPDGTYFYVIELNDSVAKNPKAGFIELFR